MAILSAARISTSGRAPLFKATSRFWMSDDSLKRPPTLLTIVSSLNSSCTVGPSTSDQNLTNFTHGAIEVVIDDLKIIIGWTFQFSAGRREPPFDFLFAIGAASANAILILVQGTGLKKDH